MYKRQLLDYKTDRRKAESDFLRAYRAQLNLYAIAIEKRFAPKKVTYKGIYSFALGLSLIHICGAARPRRCPGDPLKKYKPPSRRAYWPQRKEVFLVQTFYKICLLLLIVGGVNWGLVGLFQFDLVGWLLGGSTSVWSRIVFALVGLAALGAIPEMFSEEPEEE